MTDDQILELASEKFGIHYDRLDARFTDFARALESRVSEQDRIDALQQVVNVLFYQTSLDGAQRAVREMLIEAKGASK